MMLYRNIFRIAMLRKTLISAVFIGLCTVHGQEAEAAPRVAVSIKPIHSLVAGVMAGIAVPDLVVSGGASPHSYSLKPSDAANLNAAQIVVWVGPGLENFLEKPLATLAPSAKVLALMDVPGITRIAARKRGLWDEAASAADTDIDRHIWLDPLNAKAMVAAITTTLVQIDPANAARYSANAAALATRLDGLDANIANALAPVRTKPFVVYHDAYQYFTGRYRLNAVDAVTVSPDRAPGAKHVAAIRERIVALGAVCVFSEPEFEPKLMRTLVEGTQARTEVLDPEGTALTAGPELYFTLMRNLAENLAGCLSAE
jgi:zinc transport system substrate-binding protein